MLHQLPDHKPGAHEAEEVGEQHEDGERPVERGGLLRQQEEVYVDGQLRQQREEPVPHELGHLLLHIADEAGVQAQGLADGPEDEEDGVEDAVTASARA